MMTMTTVTTATTQMGLGPFITTISLHPTTGFRSRHHDQPKCTEEVAESHMAVTG